jgi:hypothetical protein
MVCTKCTTGTEIFSGTPEMVLLSDISQVEARFGPFGHGINLEAI